ncbi:MAG: hypothetical protein KF847_01520 [Pirellulales bacterium]|nr:hypothetical protein [Pirellulales bacterium]
MGSGLWEPVYERGLHYELVAHGPKAERQLVLPVV